MRDQLDAPLVAGLDKVDLLAVGHGFVNVDAGARAAAAGGFEGFLHSEAGVKFAPQGSAFAFADASLSSTGAAWQAGLGVRFAF